MTIPFNKQKIAPKPKPVEGTKPKAKPFGKVSNVERPVKKPRK